LDLALGEEERLPASASFGAGGEDKIETHLGAAKAGMRSAAGIGFAGDGEIVQPK
jgi:hypothetical protein